MENQISLWPDLMSAAKNPFSLVALLILLILTTALPFSGLSKDNPVLFSLILAICIIGVFVVALYGISTKNSREKIVREQESVTLAETLGLCIADASRPHISNLEIPEERVQAYARLSLYVRGQRGVTNAEFRALASEAILHYARTQGGCTKSDLDRYIEQIES